MFKTKKTVFAMSFISTKQWQSRLILFWLAFSLTIEAFSQVAQTNRYEIPVLNQERGFEIIPSGKDGLYVYRKLFGSRDDQFQMIRLDTAFKEKWNGFLPVERNYFLAGKRAHENKLYLLFRYRDFSRNDMKLYVIHGDNGSYSAHIIRGFIAFSPTEFQVTDNAAIIGGYFNRVPVVMHFSFSTMKSRMLPGLFNESGELTQVRTHDDGSFDVLISGKNLLKQRTMWIKNYDPEGNLLQNLPLEVEDNKHLIFGRSIKAENNMQLVAGVYGSRSAEFSRGIFIASIDPTGAQQTRYYNFADLENFFKYMKARREARIKNRIQRKKIKGKKIRFNYRFLVHEIIPYKNQYILLGEAFYPRYTSIDRSYGGFFNPFVAPGAIIQNGRIFDGYYYTHAVVMCFDQHGKLLWDNSFEINDVRTFTLEQFVKLEVDPEKIALLYLYDNEIRTKIIKGDEVLEGKSSDPIRTFYENEVVKKELSDKSKLEYWYNDYLYAYGVQQIVASSQKGAPKRRVFYINKIAPPK